MANYVICEREDLEAIGDVIRTKTGSSDKISLSQMQTQVGTIKGKLQSKTATPSASSQTIKPDSGYDGLSQVSVSGDANLVAGNIKNGVSIFGVAGSYEGSGGSSSISGIQVDVGIVESDGVLIVKHDLPFTPTLVAIFPYSGIDGGFFGLLASSVKGQFNGTQYSTEISMSNAAASGSVNVGTGNVKSDASESFIEICENGFELWDDFGAMIPYVYIAIYNPTDVIV